jgi:hypothetical protein
VKIGGALRPWAWNRPFGEDRSRIGILLIRTFSSPSRMALSVDEQKINDEGPTVKQALANMSIWCEQADEAKPLCEALLERLRTARDGVQRLYDTTTDKAECGTVSEFSLMSSWRFPVSFNATLAFPS